MQTSQDNSTVPVAVSSAAKYQGGKISGTSGHMLRLEYGCSREFGLDEWITFQDCIQNVLGSGGRSVKYGTSGVLRHFMSTSLSKTAQSLG